MGGEESDSIVNFRTRIDNVLRVVGEARKVNAVLLAFKLFGVFS